MTCSASEMNNPIGTGRRSAPLPTSSLGLSRPQTYERRLLHCRMQISDSEGYQTL